MRKNPLYAHRSSIYPVDERPAPATPPRPLINALTYAPTHARPSPTSVPHAAHVISGVNRTLINLSPVGDLEISTRSNGGRQQPWRTNEKRVARGISRNAEFYRPETGCDSGQRSGLVVVYLDPAPTPPHRPQGHVALSAWPPFVTAHSFVLFVGEWRIFDTRNSGNFGFL